MLHSQSYNPVAVMLIGCQRKSYILKTIIGNNKPHKCGETPLTLQIAVPSPGADPDMFSAGCSTLAGVRVFLDTWGAAATKAPLGSATGSAMTFKVKSYILKPLLQ